MTNCAQQVQVKQQELEFGKWSLASRQSKEGRLAPLALLSPISTSLRPEEAFDRIILTTTIIGPYCEKLPSALMQ